MRRGLLWAAMVVCLSTATACRIQPVRDSDVVANAAVVSVIGSTGRHGTVGTGFAIAPTRIVTARHVIEGHSDLYVRLADGRQVAAKFVVAESEEHDVAVLEIEETPDLPVLGWAAEVPQEGDVHQCVSSVGGRAQTVTTVVCTGPEEVRKRFGLVSRWRGDLGVGASGAPILDGNGRVLSMVVGADTDLAAWNAVPARVLVLEDGARWSQTAWAEKTRTEPASAARAVYDRALSVYVEKRHQEALDEFERGFAALVAVPDYAEESLVLIAVCLRELRRDAEIEARLQKAVLADPDRAWSRRVFARWLHEEGRNEEALQEARAVLRSDPNDPAAHAWVARLLLELGRFAEAETEARLDVSLHPTSWRAHSQLGTALAYLGRAEAAEVAFARALQLNPEASTARGLRAWALATLGRTSEAKTEAEEAARRAPGDAEPHAVLAWLANAAGDKEGLERELDAVRAIDPARAKEIEKDLKKGVAEEPRR